MPRSKRRLTPAQVTALWGVMARRALGEPQYMITMGAVCHYGSPCKLFSREGSVDDEVALKILEECVRQLKAQIEERGRT